MSALQTPDLATKVAQVPVWWHSIDLAGGIVTPGYKSPQLLREEWRSLRLDNLAGKSVLDIGAWDGYFSFAAERAGAERVVALDHYTWSMDLAGYGEYREAQLTAGQRVVAPEILGRYWHPDTLPGRAGFDTARAALSSRVESVVGDLMDQDFDLDALGTFDVVLYLGVLYHVRHPLLALERLARLTRPGGALLIETQADVRLLTGSQAVCRFYAEDDLNGDPSNWWTFNAAALVDLCTAAGFARAGLLQGPTRRHKVVSLIKGSAGYRAVVRAER
jgi:tRNA (mo5U34)-methyltransferase